MSDKEALSHFNLILNEIDNDLLEYRYTMFADYIQYKNDLNGNCDQIFYYNLIQCLIEITEAKKMLDKNITSNI